MRAPFPLRCLALTLALGSALAARLAAIPHALPARIAALFAVIAADAATLDTVFTMRGASLRHVGATRLTTLYAALSTFHAAVFCMDRPRR